jgi:MinD-like ATPase involved in chromosome partitioning or flagellar assembly
VPPWLGGFLQSPARIIALPKIIAIHSFRGGTGKSNTTANLAATLAGRGHRVGVVDTDIQSPGIHILFGVQGDRVEVSLNDYLWHGRPIEQTAMDVTPAALAGKIFLIPSSTKPGEITRALRQGYDAKRMTAGFRDLIDTLRLDALLIDTHPGLNEETLLSLVISHSVVVVMRPDHQDYEGTGIAIKVARGLKVPNLILVVNKAPASLDPSALAQRLSQVYDAEVAAVLPHTDEMMELASQDIFSLRFPGHPLSAQFTAIADRIGLN